MRGLMTEHGLNPDDYLDYVHRIDHSPLTPNPALGAALEKLPGRKLILTNGTRKHADAVMRRLEIHQHFEDVFDIIAAELEPKPSAVTYDRFLEKHGVESEKTPRCSRDLARNLEAPHTLGMTTVLVVPSGQREVFRAVLGTGRPRRSPRRSCHRRSGGVSEGSSEALADRAIRPLEQVAASTRPIRRRQCRRRARRSE